MEGAVGNVGIFDECVISEEFASGCTAVTTAIESTNLRVSVDISFHSQLYT